MNGFTSSDAAVRIVSSLNETIYDLRTENAALKLAAIEYAKTAEVAATRIDELENQLQAANIPAVQATNCACCGEYKHTPIREAIGYVCADCLVAERDAINHQLASVISQLGHMEQLKQAFQTVLDQVDFTSPHGPRMNEQIGAVLDLRVIANARRVLNL